MNAAETLPCVAGGRRTEVSEGGRDTAREHVVRGCAMSVACGGEKLTSCAAVRASNALYITSSTPSEAGMAARKRGREQFERR